VSATATSLLTEAQASVAQLIARLREMEAAAREQDSLMTTRLRQAQRALDEVMLQQQFARQHQHANVAALQQREQELRAMFKQIARETEEVQHARKQLDQIIRQIEMSSAVLRDEPTRAAQPDPWTLALRSQVVLGREEERVRLAREVHDGPAQVLANSLMIAEQCRMLVQEQRTADLGLMLDRMCTATREGLREVRQFIADLRPGQLAEQGLVGALQEYIRRYQQQYGTPVTLELDAEQLPRLPAETEIVLYRIVQEALQNAYKHARGAAITVQLQQRRGHLLLTIRDEGPGFDPREVARRSGRESWGLTSMRERAELIGARFHVASRVGQGTEVSVALPLT
jgi:two-component system sensor histidine kinase DegS